MPRTLLPKPTSHLLHPQQTMRPSSSSFRAVHRAVGLVPARSGCVPHVQIPSVAGGCVLVRVLLYSTHLMATQYACDGYSTQL